MRACPVLPRAVALLGALLAASTAVTAGPLLGAPAAAAGTARATTAPTDYDLAVTSFVVFIPQIVGAGGKISEYHVNIADLGTAGTSYELVITGFTHAEFDTDDMLDDCTLGAGSDGLYCHGNLAAHQSLTDAFALRGFSNTLNLTLKAVIGVGGNMLLDSNPGNNTRTLRLRSSQPTPTPTKPTRKPTPKPSPTAKPSPAVKPSPTRAAPSSTAPSSDPAASPVVAGAAPEPSTGPLRLASAGTAAGVGSWWWLALGALLVVLGGGGLGLLALRSRAKAPPG